MKSKNASSIVFAIGLVFMFSFAAYAQFWGTGSIAGGQGLSGTWTLTANAAGLPPIQSLITFTRDGGVISSGQVTSLAPTGVWVFSTAQGEWIQTGPRQYAFVFAAYLSDLKGAPVGTTRVRCSITLSETLKEFTGRAVAEDFDTSGKSIFSFEAKLVGQRSDITLFPLVSTESDPR